LSRMARPHWATPRAMASVRDDLRHGGANGRNVLNRLRDRPDACHASAAVRASGKPCLHPLVDLLRDWASRPAMARTAARLSWCFGAKAIGTTKWCRLPEGLSAHRPQLLLQLRILVAELLVLELQLSDPAPQLLGIVIGPTRRRSLRPRLAFTRRTPCHESAYKHTLATMESVFFARQRRHALNVYVGGATTSSVAHQFTVVFAEGPRTAA